jgi:YidC/Oxa1 family membrane protein insertase
MDRNQATGLILIALMLIVYLQFFAPQPTKPEEIAEPPASEKITADTTTTTTPDSTEIEALGDLADAASGEEQNFLLENSRLRISLSNRGGVVRSVELKDYKTYDGNPLFILTEDGSTFNWFTTYNGQKINLSNLFFQARQSSVGDTSVVDFTLTTSAGSNITYRYMLPPTGYQLIHRVISDNNALGDLALNWTNHVNRVERDIEVSRINTTVGWSTVDEDFNNLTERSEGLEEETINEPIRWVSIKQKFFTSAIITDKSFSSGYVAASVDQSKTNIVKTARVNVVLPATILGSENTFNYFFGPNKYEVLKGVAPEFSENLDLGWPPMSWVNRFVIIPLFNLLNNFFDNYGIIIIIMVLIIKLVLFPLSYKSYVSMAKMKVLKPQLDEIKEKHGGDQMKAQQDQLKLYQSVGVNPVSGCIPLLLQMPILLAMFYFFPESIELRQESFLWADDLSTYDAIVEWDTYIPLISSFYGNHVSLFVLLMTASTILYTWSNQQVSSIQGPMATFSYIMPIIFMFVLNSYPAALSFYYFLSNIVTFGQQWAIRHFVDDEKILKKLEENKQKMGTKKKSSFQKRLEDAMRASQEAKKKK